MLFRSFDGAQWTGVTLPVPVNAIYGRRPDDVFAVGSEGYIWHFDGAAWTAMASPVITGLRAIAGSGTDLVVVGDASTVLRLTASGWVRDLSATGPTGSLSGVWERAPNDLYVVGNGSKVAHWDGTTWVTSPLSGLTRNLRAISGRSASEIYIVGDADANGNTIVVGSSAGWTPMVNPSTENLFAVHAGASGTYAAAGAATMLEYEGAGWLELEPPAPTTRILGLWSNGASSVAVGEGCTLQVVTPGSYVTEGLFQTCSCGLSVLLDIWGTTGANGMPLYAGGTYGLLLHHTGNGWECDQPLPAPIATATSVVTSISGTSATSVFAVGRASNAPMLLHNAGTGWIDLSAELPALSGRRLNGVWAAGPDEAFMVGTEGNIAHYQGGVVTAMTSGVSATLFSVWGANPRDVYAVGDEATIIHYDGVAWKRVTGVPAGITFSTNVPFVDVHGRGSTDVWVVGGRVLLHWEGAHWQVVAQPATEPTTQVFATERGVTIGTALGIGHQLIGL